VSEPVKAADDELVQRALEARESSYSPYSGYAVGAALRAGDGLYAGANVENASYGLTICAERTAVARAVLEGARAIDAIAIATTSSPPASPCGMCLQTMLEFSPDPQKTRVLLVNPAGERRAFTLAELVPHGFVPASLER
jgi:cytidine deaminase